MVRLSNGRACYFDRRLRAAEARESERTSPRAVPGATTAITVEQLGRIFAARVTRLQLPVAISRYRVGQSISFGVLSVSQAGIGVGDESVTWDEVEDVQTKDGHVRVYKQGERGHWKDAPASMVPNYFVFDARVHTVLSERSGVARVSVRPPQLARRTHPRRPRRPLDPRNRLTPARQRSITASRHPAHPVNYKQCADLSSYAQARTADPGTGTI